MFGPFMLHKTESHEFTYISCIDHKFALQLQACREDITNYKVRFEAKVRVLQCPSLHFDLITSSRKRRREGEETEKQPKIKARVKTNMKDVGKTKVVVVGG